MIGNPQIPEFDIESMYPVSPARGLRQFEHLAWHRRIQLIPSLHVMVRPRGSEYFHVGDVAEEPPMRHLVSTEGPGLGVVNDPDYMSILLDRTPYPRARLVKKVGVENWVPVHGIDDETSNRVTELAVADGFLVPEQRYRVYMVKNEAFGFVHWTYVEHSEEADAIAKQCEPRGITWGVDIMDTYVAGPRFLEQWASSFSSPHPAALAHELGCLMVFAEAGFDGAWWDDIYWPDIESIPRGVLFPKKLSNWNIEKQYEEAVVTI